MVLLDGPIWEMLANNLVTERQAIRLQELSDLAARGKKSRMSKSDVSLVEKFALFHAQSPSQLVH